MNKSQQVRKLALERSLAANAKRNEHMHKMALNLSRQETLSVFGFNGEDQTRPLGSAHGLNRDDALEDKENKTFDVGTEQGLNRAGKRPAYQPLDGFDTEDDLSGDLSHLKDRPQNIAATIAVDAMPSTAPKTKGAITRSMAKKQKILEDCDIQALCTLRTNSHTPSTSSSRSSGGNRGRESTLSPSPSTCSDDSKGPTLSIFMAKGAATDHLYAKELHSGEPSSRDIDRHTEPESPKAGDLTVADPALIREWWTRICSSSDAKNDQDSSTIDIYTLKNLREAERETQSISSGIILVEDSTSAPARPIASNMKIMEKASEDFVSELQTRKGYGKPERGVERSPGAAMVRESIAADTRSVSESAATPLVKRKVTATATLLVSDIALNSSDIPDDASDVASDMALSDSNTPMICPPTLTSDSATGSTMPDSTIAIIDTGDETTDMDISDDGTDDGTDDMDISDTDLPTIDPAEETTNSDVDTIDHTQQTTDLDPEESESNDGDVDDVDDLFEVEAGPSKPWKGLKRLKIFTEAAYKGKRKARALLRKVNRLAAENTDKKIEAWAALGFAVPTPEQKKKPLGHVEFSKSDANRPSWDEWWVLPFAP